MPKKEKMIPWIKVATTETDVAGRLDLTGKAKVMVEDFFPGDFIIGEEHVIERKSGPDLVASIKDGRLFNELSRMKQTYEHPILLIENEKAAYSSPFFRMRVSSISGAISSVVLKFGVPIWKTKNMGATVDWLIYAAGKIQDGSEAPEFTRNRPRLGTLREKQLHFLQGFPNVRGILSQRLLDHFGTPDAFIDAIKATKVRYTPSGYPKFDGKNLFAEIKQFGIKKVLNIKEVLDGICD